ncbi:unnamed protein product [Allacma fusca]|uniref:Uncharacterized protein n=1 Tax=Allacma fusca TaxID=39272 RepID=A0A8J2NRJ4_9HEXA|nr:unnamed protein product [Allacma fusca]
MLDTYIIIVLLTVVGTVTVIILFYFILMCISALRAPPSLAASALQTRSIRTRSTQGAERQAINGPRRQSQRRATENVYMTHPTANPEEDRLSRSMTTRQISSRTGHATLTIPSNLFLNSRGLPLGGGNVSQGGHELEVLRFYTAEELANFPFDEHQRQLNSSGTPEPYEQIHRTVPIETPETANPVNPAALTIRNNNQANHHQSVFIRHPELLITPGSNSVLDSRLHRHRLCYSIPASYLGRPPAYLPHDDQPPSYDDALRLSQVDDQKDNPAPAPEQ